MQNTASRRLCVGVCLAMLVLVPLLSGCGGSETDYGGVAGYVYQPIGGGTAIVSANSTPPEGYEPVPEGTVVRIEGDATLWTATDTRGFYLIWLVRPGVQVVVVEALGGNLRLTLQIIANRITMGGGHSEGGG